MNVDALRPEFRGEILTPEAAGYDAAREIWNGMIDRRPAVIARCTGPDDVVAAVRFAAREGLHPAVRGGGHNVAGLASVDGGDRRLADEARRRRPGRADGGGRGGPHVG